MRWRREAKAAALTRRRLLAGVGLSTLAGVGGAALRGSPSPSQPAAQPAIHAATVWEDRYAGLVVNPDGTSAPHLLQVGDDRRVVVGQRLPLRLPPEFEPWGIAATGGTLWITGTARHLAEVVTVDNRADGVPEEFRDIAAAGDPALPDGVFDLEVWHHRPALYASDGESTTPIDLPVPDEIRWGAATAVVTDGRGTVVVALDGCPDPDAAVVTRSHLAVSTDNGRTWRQWLLDRSLREGYATTLTVTGGRLVAACVDGEGTRRLRLGPLGPRPELRLVETVRGGGPVAGVLSDGGDGVRLVGDGVVVNGAEGMWITVREDGAYLMG